MKKASIFLLCFLVLNLGFARRPLPEGVTHETLEFEGYEREYYFYAPSNLSAGKEYPLVLMLHGGGGRAKGTMIKQTRERFNRLADKDGFFVVYPQGLGKSWNEGGGDRKAYARKHQINDVGFLIYLVDELSQKYPINKKRVFSTGISNGGKMSYRLACERPDRFRAVAPVTAQIPDEIISICEEEREHKSGLLIMNGTDDPIMPYEGGTVTPLGMKRGTAISTDKTIDIWKKKNKCSNQPKIKQFPNLNKEDESTVISYTYSGCEQNANVILYKVEGGGHTWPEYNGLQYLPKRSVGTVNEDISASEEIWNFFKTFD